MTKAQSSRVFNGRKYELEAGPHPKKKAQLLAKGYRKMGYLARVIPYESLYRKGYLVYASFKGG